MTRMVPVFVNEDNSLDLISGPLLPGPADVTVSVRYPVASRLVHGIGFSLIPA
jgi:hypothetical protein